MMVPFTDTRNITTKKYQATHLSWLYKENIITQHVLTFIILRGNLSMLSLSTRVLLILERIMTKEYQIYG